MTGVTPPSSPVANTRDAHGSVGTENEVNDRPVVNDEELDLNPAGLEDIVGAALGNIDGEDNGLDSHDVSAEFPGDLVVKVQSAVRGFLARQTVLRMRLDQYSGYFNGEMDYFFWLLREMQQRIDTAWDRRLITQDERVKLLDDAGKLATDMYKVRAEFETALNANGSDYQQLVNEYSAKLVDINDRTMDLLSQAGFSSVGDVIALALGEDWKQQLSAEALERVETVSSLLKPLSFGIFKHKVVGSKVNYIERESDKSKVVHFSTELKAGLPIATEPKVFRSDAELESLKAAELIVPLPEGRALVIKGFFEADPLNLASATGWLRGKREELAEVVQSHLEVPSEFGKQYLDQYPIRDLAICSKEDFTKDLEKAYQDARRFNLHMNSLVEAFKRGDLSEQVRVLSLALMADNPQLGYTLYQLVGEGSPQYQEILYKSLHFSLQKKLKYVEESIEALKKKLEKMSQNDIPLKDRVITSEMPAHAKMICMGKIGNKRRGMFGGGGDDDRSTQWVESLLQVPWGKYVKDPVNHDDSLEKQRAFLKKFEDAMEAGVYGHDKAKSAFKEVVGTWIKTGSGGAVICLEGPPGNGKTTFARDAVAKALGRPFATINFGGITDGTKLQGIPPHYAGSQPGLLTDVLVEAGVMNPVILVDEFDKISQTEKGREIIGIMTQVLDPKQNHEVQESYFKGVKFPFDQVVWVLTGNDLSLVGDIVGDRMNLIKTHGHNMKDKIGIARKFTLPRLLKSVRWTEDDLKIDDDVMRFIISNYTAEAGMRQFERRLEKLIKQMNLRQIEEAAKPPFTLTEALVKDILGKPEAFMDDVLFDEPRVGVVTGLWASRVGRGGIGFTQVERTPSDEFLKLVHTGNQGKSMMEGMTVAKAVAWNLLSTAEQKRLREEPTFGLLMHTPDTSTPKDGPSGGLKNATAIYSALTGKKVNNKVAMTGEIDATGRAKKIGGLDMKLNGAKKAGCELVIIPRENEEDLQEVKDTYPELIDDNFKVVLVDHFSEVLEHALVKEDNVVPMPNATNSDASDEKIA